MPVEQFSNLLELLDFGCFQQIAIRVESYELLYPWGLMHKDADKHRDLYILQELSHVIVNCFHEMLDK